MPFSWEQKSTPNRLLSILSVTTESIERHRIILVRKNKPVAHFLHQIIRRNVMAVQASIVKIYGNADPSEKIDIICRNYPNFIGIVDSYTEGLRYMIENETQYNKKSDYGELGVRVQVKGHYSDLTANVAINNITIRDALIRCDFSEGILEGVDGSEDIQKNAYILKEMRKDYDLFNSQLRILPKSEYHLFQTYLKGESDIAHIAETEGIQYESANQKLWRVKKKVKIQMMQFLNGKM